MSTNVPLLAPLPHSTRSQVFSALYSYIQQIPAPTGSAWNTISQSVKQWDDVPAANQPAMFLVRTTQVARSEHAFGVTKWQYNAMLLIYYRADCIRTGTTPGALTDNILDSIEQLFQTDTLNGRLTLGNVVHHCWINGSIFIDEGLVDNQAVIMVPLSILL